MPKYGEFFWFKRAAGAAPVAVRATHDQTDRRAI
jgi:hypothetical protein